LPQKTKTTEQFKQEVLEKLGKDYIVLEEYKTCRIKLLMRHVLCGHEYNAEPRNILKGNRCPKCYMVPKKKTSAKFREDVFTQVGDEYTVLGRYKTNKTKILIRHNKCNHEYEVRPGDFLNNKHRCPECKILNHTKTLVKFKSEVLKLEGEKYTVIGDYITCHKHLLMRHNKCDHEYKVKPKDFLNGRRCPKCSNNGQPSKKELKLLSFIKSVYNGKIIQSDRSVLEGKEIDILLPELSLGFEFNGRYWHSREFKPEGYHKDKTSRAADKGIRLIHISENRWDNMNGPVKSMVRSFL